WRDQFFTNGSADKNQILGAMDVAKSAASEVFAGVAAGVRRAGWSEAHASSGTVKMLANICEGQGHPPAIISLQALHEVKPTIAQAIAAGEGLHGLKEARRDLALPGWSVLTGLMEAYQVDELRFSATALREGMLDFMVKNEKTLSAMTESDLPDVSFAKH
ncbi:MAG: hypothetical protein MI746_07140, partial [Pseudomonadales bacterium]|nr:hypothetical protein [Pseudomonadales bacterium]